MSKTAQERIEQLYRLIRKSTLVPPDRRHRPRPGDTVIDVSKFTPDVSMIGVLESIDDAETNPIYHVTGLDGDAQRWSNAEPVVIKMNIQ